MNRVLKLLRITRSHHRRLYLAILVGLLLTVLMIVPPYMTKLLIDQVYPNQDQSLLYVVVIATALFAIFSDLIAQVKDYFVHFLNMRLSLGTNFEFYRHLSTMDISFYSNRKVGEISARARDALDSVGGMMQIVNTFIMSSITLVIFPPILLFINWKLALLSLAALPFDFLISFAIARYTASRTRRISRINAEVNARKVEFLSGMGTIQALSIEEEMFGRIRDGTLGSAHIRIGMIFWQRAAAFVTHSLRALSVLFYTWYGWTRILSGELSLGTYMAFTMYSGYLTGPIKGLLGLVSRLQVLLVHVDRFTEIYDMQPEIRSPPSPIAEVRFKGAILFQNVSFAYGSGPPVLRNLDLSIEPGTTVGILGASGTGKTSLVQLIPRFYDPTEGEVHIDGHDIRRLELTSLRRQVSYMQQDSFIFSGSILENIAAGSPETDRDGVEAAARKARIHDAIVRLEEGYDTQAGERGSRLSHGQRQRIVLARLLLRRSPIAILDEATSALDLETESRVLHTLREELAQVTTIIITHRLSAVRHADHIVMLREGAISAQGDYGSLLAGDDLFARMHAETVSRELPQAA